MEQSPKNVEISQYPKDTQKITAGMAFSLYRSIQKSQSSLFEADIYPIFPRAF